MVFLAFYSMHFDKGAHYNGLRIQLDAAEKEKSTYLTYIYVYICAMSIQNTSQYVVICFR